MLRTALPDMLVIVAGKPTLGLPFAFTGKAPVLA